jgi:hypothetical protein
LYDRFCCVEGTFLHSLQRAGHETGEVLEVTASDGFSTTRRNNGKGQVLPAFSQAPRHEYAVKYFMSYALWSVPIQN